MPEPSPLSDAQAQRLIKLYSEAEAEILGEINRLLMGPPKDYSLAWQRTILQRTQQIKADLLKGSRTWCQEAIPASYMKGVGWADKDPQSGQMVKAGFGSIHQQAVEVLADNAYSRLENVAHVVGRNVDDISRKISLEAVKGSVIGYKTTSQAARDIRQDLAKHGITGFVDKAGHQWNMRRYARVLAQETTNGAFRHGTINRLQEKGHDLVRISSHAGSCKLCQPYQGQTFSLTGEDKEFPPLSSAKGLFHVGCLHVISLAPEEKDRFIGRLQGKEGADVRAAEIKRLAEKAGWKEATAVKPRPYMIDADGITNTEVLNRVLDKFDELNSKFGVGDKFGGFRSLDNDRVPMSIKHNAGDAFVTAWGQAFDAAGNKLRDEIGDPIQKIFIYLPPKNINDGVFSEDLARMGIVHNGSLDGVITHEFAHVRQLTASNKFDRSIPKSVLEAAQRAYDEAGITPKMLQKNVSMYANGFGAGDLKDSERFAELFTAIHAPSDKVSKEFAKKLSKYQSRANELFTSEEYGGIGSIV